MSEKTDKASRPERDFRARCESYLLDRWRMIEGRAADPTQADPLGDRPDMREWIIAALTSRTKSYHYVLPTQLLAKCVNPALDARSIQVSYGLAGAFDARSLAHEVIVPFDQRNYGVLGGAPEPYANNPLRVPGVTAAYAGAQKQQGDWASLIRVLDAIERADDPALTVAAFDQVLLEIHRMLDAVRVVYPTPNRVSLDATYRLCDTFLAEKSGGDRMEALAAALFDAIGARFGLFDEVRREKVNSADKSSGMAADIECRANGRIVLLVEVKDRALTLTQLGAKLDRARAGGIVEILFIAQGGRQSDDEAEISRRISQEFTSGQNVYVANFNDFALGVFILLGEDGRVDFLRRVGPELDRGGSAIQHRRRWAELLRDA